MKYVKLRPKIDCPFKYLSEKSAFRVDINKNYSFQKTVSYQQKPYVENLKKLCIKVTVSYDFECSKNAWHYTFKVPYICKDIPVPVFKGDGCKLAVHGICIAALQMVVTQS